MHSYTENNHLKFGWVIQKNQPTQKVYCTKIGRPDRKPFSAFEEAQLAARKIFENSASEIVLCMSGGVDSECMALAFMAANIPFKVAIWKYSLFLNDYDITPAIRFCESHHLKYQIMPLDLFSFFESGKHIEYAHLYRCRSPQLAVHIHMLKQIKGVPILSWNPCEVTFYPALKTIDVLIPSEPQLAYLRYFMKEQRHGIPFFFAYTPELIHSFWQTPQFQKELEFVKWALQTGLDEAPPNYLGKVKKYQEGGFCVQPRDDKKTGFEKAKIFFNDDLTRTGRVREEFPGGLEPFDYIYRKPLVDLYPYPFPVVKIFSKDHFPKTDLLNPPSPLFPDHHES